MDPSKSAILELCSLTSSKVSAQDFREFLPDDSNHSRYLKILESVLSSDGISKDDGAFLSDAYFWTSQNNEMDRETAGRLRNYRIFLNSIALLLIQQNDYSEQLYPANYSAAEWLIDSYDFDRENIDLLRSAFGEAREALAHGNQTQCLFFRFGQIVFSDRLGEDQAAGELATLLLAEEAEMISNPKTKFLFQDSRFLLGATSGFDRYVEDWKFFASNLQNRSMDLDIRLIQTVIQNDSWPGAPTQWQASEPSLEH